MREKYVFYVDHVNVSLGYLFCSCLMKFLVSLFLIIEKYCFPSNAKHTYIILENFRIESMENLEQLMY